MILEFRDNPGPPATGPPMSDTAPLHPEPLHGGAAGLAARLAILGALLFLGVAGSL